MISQSVCGLDTLLCSGSTVRWCIHLIGASNSKRVEGREFKSHPAHLIPLHISDIRGHWRSQVAHPAFNRTVMGSNPIWPATSTHKSRGSQVVKGGRLKTFSQRSSQVQILSPTPILKQVMIQGNLGGKRSGTVFLTSHFVALVSAVF